ncbi:MAG: hypothetical protein A2350_02500 [Candidatus Raymondbacteria bacterium RifOxyB12_full_50_8]|nr:MAG: hypothetical protein A2350_02500 [Candidatus Raymondbacteria bacterium RifOxyB12_full_50_8]
MGKIFLIRELILHGMYYLSSHALVELEKDGLDEFDAETALLHGKIRRSWPNELKFEIYGPSNDNRIVGIVCKITKTSKLRIITGYEDKP